MSGAIKQIWGAFQTAGVAVIGTGKSAPTSDATQPYAQLVAIVDADGVLVPTGWTPSNITTNATTVVKNAAGVLHSVSVNTAGTTSTATIYNNTAGSGTKIGTVDTTSIGTVTFDATCSTGITVVTAGAVAADITVTYR